MVGISDYGILARIWKLLLDSVPQNCIIWWVGVYVRYMCSVPYKVVRVTDTVLCMATAV